MLIICKKLNMRYCQKRFQSLAVVEPMTSWMTYAPTAPCMSLKCAAVIYMLSIDHSISKICKDTFGMKKVVDFTSFLLVHSL